MRRILFSFLFWLVSSLPSIAQQQWNLPLLSNWDDDSIPAAWTGSYSECWGYVAPDDREYAFLASTQGTYFFDISQPASPVLIDFVRTKDTTTLVVNKDFATYQNYLYAVSDQGDNSLQIFDLKYLPDSIVKVYDSNVISKRCHTIFVENNRLYMASNTRPDGSFGKLDVYSLSNPVNPVWMGTLSHPGFYSVHEAFVKNDTAYCANGTDGLWIYDMTTPNAANLISILDVYPESGYNHSAWLTADGKTMVFTDENHGRGVKIYDMTDIEDPQLRSIVRSNMLMISDSLSNNGSVAHNPYIVGNILFLSYYHDGVKAYDISDPANPVLIAYYDTHPQNTSYYSYNGCWGLYPFLPSGNIIASDITNGLFILDGRKILKYDPPAPSISSTVILANPVQNELELIYDLITDESSEVTIYDMTGRLVSRNNFSMQKGRSSVEISVQSLSSGIYIASVRSNSLSAEMKFVKVKN